MFPCVFNFCPTENKRLWEGGEWLFPFTLFTETIGQSAQRDLAADDLCHRPQYCMSSLYQFKGLSRCRPHLWVEGTDSSFSLTQAVFPTIPPKLIVPCDRYVAKCNRLFQIWWSALSPLHFFLNQFLLEYSCFMCPRVLTLAVSTTWITFTVPPSFTLSLKFSLPSFLQRQFPSFLYWFLRAAGTKDYKLCG